MVTNLPAMQETRVQSQTWKDPLEKAMATTPVFFPGEFHGHRSLAGYSPWGHKESGRLRRDWSNLACMHTSHFDLLCQLNCCCLREAVFCFREYFYKVQETKILSPTFKLGRSVFFKSSYRKSKFLVFRSMNSQHRCVYSSNHHHSQDTEQFPSQKIPCRITLSHNSWVTSV